uniref:Uncharacterized protein n=1 Tax=Mus musculus TaxID=10090 RepID=Q8BNC0_MOUSE|nr:unnamed protein product [Mus musculus]|eukprot:XP_017171215.1 PREDICTED: alpha38-takusan isoform X2 [Mus musculus]
MELHSCGCGGGGGGRDRRGGRGGGGANASEAREHRVPALCRSVGAGRQDGAAARAPRAWIPESSLGGNGAPGVSPSSPTLLFRRWVRKVESLISQPMTSGKNELQDHLIFISEKALHKRYFSFCQTSWSISWVYGMAYNLFLLNFMVLGDCNSRVSLCPTFSP